MFVVIALINYRIAYEVQYELQKQRERTFADFCA